MLVSEKEIFLRLAISLFFSGIIGLEREKNQSNAGIKTHSLVGISATLIAMIQVEISHDAIKSAIAHPELISLFGADPSRLTAQVISGIGFLGAGTIIVTKRSISGLTTAASIWSVACLGIAVGMGYFFLSFASFLVIFSILFLFKRILRISVPTKLVIKYIGGTETLEEIKEVLQQLKLKYTTIKYDVRMYGDIRVYSNVFEIESLDRKYFDKLLNKLANNEHIINCEQTRIEL